MKKTTLISYFLIVSLITNAAIKIDRLEPAFWWTGMQNKELQIMVYGPNIAQCEVSVKYPGITLDRCIKLESPNYLFLYLTLSDNLKPDYFDIYFRQGKQKTKYRYELKPVI